jgi:hypothetical protein
VRKSKLVGCFGASPSLVLEVASIVRERETEEALGAEGLVV